MLRSEELLLDKVMELYPGPARLTQTRWIRIALLVVCSVGTVLLLLLAYPGVGSAHPHFSRGIQVAMGLIFAAPCVLGIVLTTRDLLRPHTVVMNDKGFTITSPKGEDHYTWRRVEKFRIVSGGESADSVVFDLVYDRKTKPRKVKFPDSYGLTADALCSLMQRWRGTALQTKRGPRPS